MPGDHVGESCQLLSEFKRVTGDDNNQRRTGVLNHALNSLKAQRFLRAAGAGIEQHSLILLVNEDAEMNNIPSARIIEVPLEMLRSYAALVSDAVWKKAMDRLNIL